MHVPPVLRTLLSGAIDYAGLYPPAALPMPEAAARFADYRASDDRWALGAFVVGASRLDELVRARGELAPPSADDRWPLSVLLGPALAEDARRIAALRAGDAPFTVVSVEARGASAEDVRRVRDACPPSLAPVVYCELPHASDPAPLIDEVARLGMRAKIRTGGVTADAVPSVAEVARFLDACVAAEVPVKATAGLHHPLRGEYPLTYERGAPRAPMHGWLNLLLAAAILAGGGVRDEAEAALAERAAEAFRVDDGALLWRGHRLDAAALARARTRVVPSFGSCSFREPLDELAAIPSLLRPT